MYGIRFIDSRYNELFRLKDGNSIVITTQEGIDLKRPCRYIDETHVEAGNNLYHICEFAERMEQARNSYAPAEPATAQANKTKPRKGKTDMER